MGGGVFATLTGPCDRSNRRRGKNSTRPRTMKRILVIDDDEQIRQMLHQLFEREGFVVDLAQNGKEALAKNAIHPADVIITDLIMPEQDGVETIMEFIRKDATAKVIAISGGGKVGPNDYLAMAAALGASRTFAKPFKRSELLSAVKELIAEE